MTPRQLAKRLSDRFFAEGLFEGIMEGAPPAAVAAADQPVAAVDDVAFAGLGIQAVGYSDEEDRREVHIYVARGSAATLRGLEVEANGIAVRVHRMAPLRVYPQQSGRATYRGLFFTRNGKVACGSSCAPSSETYSGTLGALVRDANGEIYILSNNHVLAACNHIAPGLPILSPSTGDSHPSLPSPQEIGRHSHIVELRSGDATLVQEATVDAAVGKATEAVCSWQGDAAGGYDTPDQIIAPASGMRVKKWGRTTGLTVGTIQSELIRVSLPYKSKHFSALVYFTNVWPIYADGGEDFAVPGDSGSLVVTEDGRFAVGLIFATTTSGSNYGIMATITNTLAQLNRQRGLRGLTLLSGYQL